MSHALVLFAHGSRNPEWGRSLAALAEEVRRCDTSVDVRTAFLELQEPGLDEVIDALVGGGQRRIDVFPVFWAAGSHVAVDAPAILDAARERHAGLDARLLPAISDVPGLTAWLASTVLSLCADGPGERLIMKGA
jgi:sirohydrochlorin cobaltochelatase